MVMESIGKFFKQARESQGLSLDQVASQTRIQQPYLEALEEENFSKLPEQVFTKGFVKTYARSLGVDEDEALRRFSESSGSFYEKDQEEKREAVKRVEEVRKGKLNRNIVILITGIALVMLIYFLPRKQFVPMPPGGPEVTQETTFPGQRQDVTPSSPSQSDSLTRQSTPSETKPIPGTEQGSATRSPKPAESPRSLREQDIPASPSTGSGTESTGNLAVEKKSAPPSPPITQMPKPIGNQNLVLELEAKEMTWVVVRSDEGEPQEALLQPGETARWKASEHFFLTLGNAGGVFVKVNGEPRGPFGKPGAVVRDLEINP